MGDGVERFFSAMAHWQLGDEHQALELFGRGVVWIEENSPVEDRHARYRAEAAELLGVEDASATAGKEMARDVE